MRSMWKLGRNTVRTRKGKMTATRGKVIQKAPSAAVHNEDSRRGWMCTPT